MLQGEHSAILLTFIKLPFVIKIFVMSIFEWPFYTGFAVHIGQLGGQQCTDVPVGAGDTYCSCSRCISPVPFPRPILGLVIQAVKIWTMTQNRGKEL